MIAVQQRQAAWQLMLGAMSEFAGAALDASEQLLIAVQGWIGFLAYQSGDVQRHIGEMASTGSASAAFGNHA